MFTAATETTCRIIGARRLSTLRTLVQSMMGSTSPEQVFAEASRALDTARSDVPCSAAYRPRRLKANPEDEGGRGVQMVALLADRWGVRPADTGKATWCVTPEQLQDS